MNKGDKCFALGVSTPQRHPHSSHVFIASEKEDVHTGRKMKLLEFPIMYGCESWTIKKAECQRIDAFELWCWRRLLKSPLDSKEIKPVNPKGNHPSLFIGRTDTEAKVPILWPLDAKSWLIGKDPDAGKDWRQEENGVAEDEMVGWHHQLIGHEFEQAPGDSKGQGSLVCCNLWGGKEIEIRLRDWTTAMRTSCIAQGTLLSTLWGPKWEGSPKGRGYVYMCGWFILL